MNVGTPHTCQSLDGLGVLGLHQGEGLAGGDLVEHGVGVDAVAW